MFRRKKRPESDADYDIDEATIDDRGIPGGADADHPEGTGGLTEPASSEDWAPRPVTPPRGPWDEADAPDDGIARLDLGSLLVPLLAGVEARVEVDGEGHVIAATLVAGTSPALPDGTSLMQLTAFAAPRSAGIWGEVREEIATAITEGGGRAELTEGPLGTEVRALVPGGEPGQLAAARFVGVDGPRWFLRAALSGAAGSDPTADGVLLELFRGVVVKRGDDAMAVRDMLALRMPKEFTEAAAAAEVAAVGEGQLAPEEGEQSANYSNQSLNPFLRGPEITEIR